MHSDTIWRHVDTERAVLADIVEALPDDAWRTPSLCDAWTVRDVAAHLTFSHAGVRDLLVLAARSGFRYNAAVRDAALRCPLGHEQIVDTLRGFVGSRRTRPWWRSSASSGGRGASRSGPACATSTWSPPTSPGSGAPAVGSRVPSGGCSSRPAGERRPTSTSAARCVPSPRPTAPRPCQRTA
jgi:uncharacterized protein (TIGR03083 family)